MKTFLHHIRENIGLYILLAIFSVLFLVRIDFNTLNAWDEAWYGVIARNMMRSGDFLRMNFNSLPFYDHPPAGFWLMAISYKLLGVSEFSTRLPSVLCGIGTIALIYLSGIALFGKKSIGFVAALMMGTCVWYILRVRSGNLDSTFAFFYMLTVYCSIRAHKNFKWFIVSMASFGFLMLTKTLLGTSVLVLIFLANFKHVLVFIRKPNRAYIIYAVLGVTVAAVIILPWYIANYLTYPNFYQHHFIDIGTRNNSLSTYLNLKATEPLYYLHMGIRKWYYLWIAALGVVLVTRDFLKKEIAFLLIWNLLVLYPFLTTTQTEIWHLIPVYLPIVLLTAYGWHRLLTIIPFKEYMTYLFIFIFVVIGALQVKTFAAEVFPANKYTPNDVAISKASHSLSETVYLDDDFLPMAVFYADRQVYPIRELPLYGIMGIEPTLTDFYNSKNLNFAVITRSWVTGLFDERKIPYTVIEKNNEFVIMTR